MTSNQEKLERGIAMHKYIEMRIKVKEQNGETIEDLGEWLKDYLWDNLNDEDVNPVTDITYEIKEED